MAKIVNPYVIKEWTINRLHRTYLICCRALTSVFAYHSHATLACDVSASQKYVGLCLPNARTFRPKQRSTQWKRHHYLIASWRRLRPFLHVCWPTVRSIFWNPLFHAMNCFVPIDPPNGKKLLFVWLPSHQRFRYFIIHIRSEHLHYPISQKDAKQNTLPSFVNAMSLIEGGWDILRISLLFIHFLEWGLTSRVVEHQVRLPIWFVLPLFRLRFSSNH